MSKYCSECGRCLLPAGPDPFARREKTVFTYDESVGDSWIKMETFVLENGEYVPQGGPVWNRQYASKFMGDRLDYEI